MTDGYATLATDYHWLRSEESVLAVLARHAGGSASGRDARILDCACGIGTDAITLANDGREVWASDGSAAMVAEARRRTAAAGVPVPVEVCRWDGLPDRFGERFDLVLCLGNSISHVGRTGMTPAFEGMASVLADGGRLIVNARNWEKLRRDRPRLTSRDRVVEGEGGHCVPIYLWRFASGWDEPHGVEIVLVIETAGSVAVRTHELTFWPFRLVDVRRCLERAGLRVVGDNHHPEADWYEVVAEKPPP